MIVAIHQPHFLPWLGYMARMQQADLFVLLDHVQFERQNYQNRVLIKTGEGPRWITVPVFQNSQHEKIVDKQIDNHADGRQRWGRKVFLQMKYAYQGAPFFKRYESSLQELLDQRWEKLNDLNLALLQFLREAMDIRTPMISSSNLGVSGQKSEMVLALCKAVEADTFLGGMGGSRGYLDLSAFKTAGINVAWQGFSHPRYIQHPRPDLFTAGVSSLDLLFNCGPESCEILKGRVREHAEV
jgi:hypothetical protein